MLLGEAGTNMTVGQDGCGGVRQGVVGLGWVGLGWVGCISSVVLDAFAFKHTKFPQSCLQTERLVHVKNDSHETNPRQSLSCVVPLGSRNRCFFLSDVVHTERRVRCVPPHVVVGLGHAAPIAMYKGPGV